MGASTEAGAPKEKGELAFSGAARSFESPESDACVAPKLNFGDPVFCCAAGLFDSLGELPVCSAEIELVAGTVCPRSALELPKDMLLVLSFVRSPNPPNVLISLDCCSTAAFEGLSCENVNPFVDFSVIGSFFPVLPKLVGAVLPNVNFGAVDDLLSSDVDFSAGVWPKSNLGTLDVLVTFVDAAMFGTSILSDLPNAKRSGLVPSALLDALLNLN